MNKRNATELIRNFWNYHNKVMSAIDNENRSKNRNLKDFLKPVNIDYERARKILIGEINFWGYLGANAIYAFAYEEIFYFDEQKTLDFLLSNYGGFTKGEINHVICKRKYHEREKVERATRKQTIDNPAFEISIAHTVLQGAK